jgi:hypothetical protein
MRSMVLKSHTTFDSGWLFLLHLLLTADNTCFNLATGTMLVITSGVIYILNPSYMFIRCLLLGIGISCCWPQGRADVVVTEVY